MRVRIVRVVWRDGNRATVWRVGNTLCSTFRASGLGAWSEWCEIEAYPLDIIDRGKDLVTLACEMWDTAQATVVLH